MPMRVVLAIKVYPFSHPANLQQQLIRPLVIAPCELFKCAKEFVMLMRFIKEPFDDYARQVIELEMTTTRHHTKTLCMCR